MNACDDFIEKARIYLPELCTTKDLVKFGIFRSEQSACVARKKGISPDYFKMPHGLVVYPKTGIIEFLQKAKHSSKDFICENYDTRSPYIQNASPSNAQRICL